MINYNDNISVLVLKLLCVNLVKYTYAVWTHVTFVLEKPADKCLYTMKNTEFPSVIAVDVSVH